MSIKTQICGIDVSKDTLDYYLIDTQKPKIDNFEQIPNDLNSIEAQFEKAQFDETLFVFEYTGTYSTKLMYQLSKLNRAYSVVSPLQSKAFMSAMGISNKNDKQAAQSLAQMGAKLQLPLYKFPSPEMQKRKQILGTLRSLEKQERILKNQLHALEQLPIIDSEAQQALQVVLQTVQKQLEPIRNRLNEAANTESFNKKKKFAKSVKGIGPKTAESLLMVTRGFEGFDNCDKVSKFIGITPTSHFSGTSVRRKGSITKFGNNELRGLLYMCTRSAIRYNQPCKELYERLRKRGKPHKVAAVAVMHKLVKQVYACVTNETLFDNEYHLKSKE